MIKDMTYTGSIIQTDGTITISGQLIISKEQAKEWDVYPDWENRQTLCSVPCLLYVMNNDELQIKMPVGDYSLAPIDMYLSEKDVKEIYELVRIVLKRISFEHIATRSKCNLLPEGVKKEDEQSSIRFVLISVFDREIITKTFNTIEAAQIAMSFQFTSAGATDSDIECNEALYSDDVAWLNNRGNYDWKIVPVY